MNINEEMNEQTKSDIEKAEAKVDICIQSATFTKSPYEDYLHSSNPCVQNILVNDMGWTKATREEILALYQ